MLSATQMSSLGKDAPTASQQPAPADTHSWDTSPSQNFTQQQQQGSASSLLVRFQHAGWQLWWWSPLALVVLNPIVIHLVMVLLPGCFTLGEGILLAQGIACVLAAAAQELYMLPAVFVPWGLLQQLLQNGQRLLVGLQLLLLSGVQGPLVQQVEQLLGWIDAMVVAGGAGACGGCQQQQQGGVLPAFTALLLSTIFLLCVQLRLLVLTLKLCWPSRTPAQKEAAAQWSSPHASSGVQMQACQQKDKPLQEGARLPSQGSIVVPVVQGLLGCLLVPLLLLSILPLLLVLVCLAIWILSCFLGSVPSRLALLGYWVAVLLGVLPLMKSAAVRAGLPQVRAATPAPRQAAQVWTG
jgi:hypothetical protein